MNEGIVCFIIPPSPFLLDERVFISLGVLKIVAVVRQRRRVDVLDLSGIANYQEAVRDYLADCHPASVGISITTPQMPAVFAIISEIRRNAKDIRIILGGPHVTLTHSAYRKEKDSGVTGRATKAFLELTEIADVLVSGDGEKAIWEALETKDVKVIDADDVKSQYFLKSIELDSLPWPSRDMVDVSSYHYSIDGVSAMSLVSQLGCPFGCRFCGGRNSPSLRLMRSRSPENVIAEIAHLYHTYGTRGFMFYDDELNVNRLFPDLMRGIIELQKEFGVEFRLRGFVKSHLFNSEQAELMYKAGFRWILVGFESGSPEMLINMNKRATVDDNYACVKNAHEHGLKVKALMSIGHPGESPDSARATRDWLIDAGPDDFDVSVITVYPGTPYYDDAVQMPDSPGTWVYTSKDGSKLYSFEVDYLRVADFYKGDPNDGYKSFVFTDSLLPEDIVLWRNKIESDVRLKLSIPYQSGVVAQRYEHSMGQSGLPSRIMKRSEG